MDKIPLLTNVTTAITPNGSHVMLQLGGGEQTNRIAINTAGVAPLVEILLRAVRKAENRQGGLALEADPADGAPVQVDSMSTEGTTLTLSIGGTTLTFTAPPKPAAAAIAQRPGTPVRQGKARKKGR